MRKGRWLVVILVAASVAGTSGCDKILGLFRAHRAAVQWEGPIKEIAFQKLDKDGKVFDIELHSRIDAPIDKVWEAAKHPEKLSEYSKQYKLSKLLKEEGNVKELELHVMALDNLQTFTVRLTFEDPTHTIHVQTLASSLADITGTYQMIASPAGTKTLYIYKAKQTDKVALPLSVDVQRSAIKESFVNQVRAIKAQIGIPQSS